MIPFSQIQPGDVVYSASGHVGTVVSLWHDVEFAGTALARERLRLVADDGRFQMPWDYRLVVSIERDGAEVQPVDEQMELW